MEILTKLETYFLVFIIYSICGWIIEEIFCSIVEKKIVNRGFLLGPICPIYGIGGIGMTLALTRFEESPFVVFCMAIVLAAILEYLTSYVMEKLFNARWWDYSDKKLNLDGRICIETLIPFGVFGLIVIYAFNPLIFRNLSKIPELTKHITTAILFVLTLTDFIVSVFVISKVTKTADRISRETKKDDTNEITKQIKEELQKTLSGKRLVDAFPEFTTLKRKVKIAVKKTTRKGKVVIEKSKIKSKEAIEKSKQAVKKAEENIVDFDKKIKKRENKADNDKKNSKKMKKDNK